VSCPVSARKSPNCLGKLSMILIVASRFGGGSDWNLRTRPTMPPMSTTTAPRATAILSMLSK
jgi:hypothetical protein